MKKWFEYVFIWLIVKLVRLLPLPAARRLADLLAWILYRLLGLRRKVVLENLKRAFPEWTEEKRRDVARGCYHFYARAGVEWVKFETVFEHEKFILDELQKLDNYREEGALLVTGHLGYWELLGALIADRYGGIYVYADVQSNPYSQSLIDNMRSRMNVTSGAGMEGIRGLSRQLQRGGFAGFVADQRPRGKPAVVSFFGSPVKSTRIPAVVARRTEAAVVPAFAVRSAENEITVKVEDPLPVSREGLKEGQEDKLLNQYNRILEKYIDRYSKQYFWLHNRWKGTQKLPVDKSNTNS